MQDKRSGLQAHVDEREQGQNNSINALQIKIQKLKCTVTLSVTGDSSSHLYPRRKSENKF